jgi:hypothetical protein
MYWKCDPLQKLLNLTAYDTCWHFIYVTKSNMQTELLPHAWSSYRVFLSFFIGTNGISSETLWYTINLPP